MGFKVTHNWEVSHWNKLVSTLMTGIECLIPNFIEYIIPQALKRPIIFLLSISINFGLFYVILTSIILSNNNINDLTDKNQKKLMAIFTLNENIPEPVEKKKQTKEQINDNQPLQQVIEPIIQYPPEWTVTNIASRQNNDANLTNRNSTDSLSVYDPYAGASPQRSTNEITGLDMDYTNSDPSLNRTIFEEWVKKLKAKLKRANGSIKLSVVISDQGYVTEANILNASASKQVQLFIRQDAIGEQLFKSGGGIRELPSINL